MEFSERQQFIAPPEVDGKGRLSAANASTEQMAAALSAAVQAEGLGNSPDGLQSGSQLGMGRNVLSPRLGEEVQAPGNPRSLKDYSIRFPEHMSQDEIDAAMLERYCQFCLNSGFSPDQAQQAVDFYLAEQRLANDEGATHCEAILRQVWQGNFQRRLDMARRASKVMNKRLDGRLSPLLAAGLGNNPVFAELMALVGEAISEDSLGLSHGGSELFRPMSTEEFLRTEVFAKR